MKLWGGRFRKQENQLMEDFNSSLHIDQRLYVEDITASLAHVSMLVACQVISDNEGAQLTQGLHSILTDLEKGTLSFTENFEDIHSFIEAHLIARIGETGKKLHTARSRNDQVAVDMRLYAKKQALVMITTIEDLQHSLQTKADENPILMPGYTHLQRAQIVTLKHHLMAYYHMLERDKKRIINAVAILNECPLGCGALAGTTHTINRDLTSTMLGFSKPVDNFMDGVSDRDFLLELMSCFSIIMMHLSRLSEELILWSSQEFKFIQIDDAYATGSSIMPQKKNPDAAELIRGKTGRVYGSLMSLLTTMKGLPLAYNKDMQEDKEAFFTSLDTTHACLQIMSKMISTMHVNKDHMVKAVKQGFLNATELADYLVKKGTPFRDAHRIVGEIVIYCEDHAKSIEDLTLEELKTFHPIIDTDMYEYVDVANVINKGIKPHMK